MIEDSELRGVVALGAMEAVTRLLSSQHPGEDISVRDMSHLMLLLTESVRDAMPAAQRMLHPPAVNDEE